ncbi:MAG: monooxygenase [Egibacteraceae bacterium]
MVPLALARAGVDPWRMRATRGLRFVKVLGTGDGRTFTLRDADPLRWGLLCVFQDEDTLAEFERASRIVAAWRGMAREVWRADLALIHSRGRWARREPFGEPVATGHDGPVAALTRARLRPARARTFWRAVPSVAQDLRDQPGLRYSIGIGEAPIGLQGTFSVWDSAQALTNFAYRGAAHREVVRRTAEVGWYAEELFARFAVVRTTGTIDGADPLEPHLTV